MEDIVAVRVVTEAGLTCYYLTWGRIQDPVDPTSLEALVESRARADGLEPVRAEACDSLQQAAQEHYFFEGLITMAQQAIPFGEGYEAWRQEMHAAMEHGREIYLLGREMPT